MTARIVAFAFLLAAASHSASAADDDHELYRIDASGTGRPEQFVAPAYPAAALEKGLTGYVDVDGQVDGLRAMRDIEFHPGSSEAEIFVPALREVAKFWSFYPPYRKGTCFPADTRLGVRVFFDIADGKPKISFETLKPPPWLDPLHARCPHPRYPRGPLREGSMANVYTRVEIKPDGTVAQVETEVYATRGPKSESFADEVKSALGHCRFDPAPEGAKPRAACYDVLFHLDR